MGSLNSKVSPSAEIAPELENGSYLDPRSPTLHINRSPISQEHTGTSRSSITKMKNLTSTLAEPSDHTLRTPYSHLLPKRFQSIIDPRSPSTFDRTPLVLDPERVADCSLTNVVSSLDYEEKTPQDEPEEEAQDVSFKDCDTQQLPDIFNLQIEHNDSVPIIETPSDEKEITIFEDAEVAPFAGSDPRSPCIAIARTPMVLAKQEVEEEANEPTIHQQVVANLETLQSDLQAVVEKQQHTPKQYGMQECENRSEQTPKKGNKQTPGSAKSGQRTPLGCVTNIGTASSNIRKMALIGQIKQNIVVADEKKLIPRNGNTASAELSTSNKQSKRSRIPKIRMS